MPNVVHFTSSTLSEFSSFFRMLVAQQSEYTIKRLTRKTTVPNNNIAKLMYYLNCVKQLVTFDIPKFLIDYQNYDDLDSNDKNAVLLYAQLLAPDDLLKHNVIVQVSSLPGEFNNEFLDVTRDKKGLTITPEFIFGERRVCTRQIMLCNQYWLDTFYNEPINYYDYKIKSLLWEHLYGDNSITCSIC